MHALMPAAFVQNRLYRSSRTTTDIPLTFLVHLRAVMSSIQAVHQLSGS